MEQRERDICKVTLVGSAVNVLLTLFKFVAGIVGHSTAMTADAIHSLSDLLTDAVVLLFIRISGKPEDCGHGSNHGLLPTALCFPKIGIYDVQLLRIERGFHSLFALPLVVAQRPKRFG